MLYIWTYSSLYSAHELKNTVFFSKVSYSVCYKCKDGEECFNPPSRPSSINECDTEEDITSDS